MIRWAVCTVLSGAGFYASTGLGEIWALAWIAPVPVLWLALGSVRWAPVFAAAFAAHALGGLNLLQAYLGVLPPPVLVIAIVGPALLFALAVLGGWFAGRRLGGAAGVLGFAVLWAGFDFLLAFDPSGGSALTPAASQVAVPALIQMAAIAGFSGVTFVLGVISATLALALHRRSAGIGSLAAVLFCANLGFGFWQMSAAPGAQMRVALIASDEAIGKIWESDAESAREVIAVYAGKIRELTDERPDLIVLPENLMRLDAGWRDEALAPLAAAAEETGTDIVAGFNTQRNGALGNVAWIAQADGTSAYYQKRQLVPGLEIPLYARGNASLVLPRGVGIAICKDLDFPDMIRADVAANRPVLMAVPAWDFSRDGWSHARIAILRGVENGVAVARSAREGELTLTDRFGQLVARASSGKAFTTVTADLPVATAYQPTVYNRFGFLSGWVFLAAGGLLLAVAAVRPAQALSSMPKRLSLE